MEQSSTLPSLECMHSAYMCIYVMDSKSTIVPGSCYEKYHRLCESGLRSTVPCYMLVLRVLSTCTRTFGTKNEDHFLGPMHHTSIIHHCSSSHRDHQKVTVAIIFHRSTST